MAIELITDTFESDIGANDPWPDDVAVYRPVTCSQILMPENSYCLAVEAYLRMCNLKYKVVERKNAEEMSPSGRVPFMKCGEFVVCEFESITSFVAHKGITLNGELDSIQKGDMRAYIALIKAVLFNAQMYLVWVDHCTYNEVTHTRVSHSWPWPLGRYIAYTKKRAISKQLRALGWLKKSVDKVYNEVDTCLTTLSDRLEENKYFFGEKPTELDALLFGYIFSMLTTPLPNNRLATIARSYPNLIKHCQTVEKEYFKESTEMKLSTRVNRI